MIEFCEETLNEFINSLYEKQDLKYKNFNDKIVNGVGESIGIRVPELRKIAKDIAKSEQSFEMLQVLDTQNLFEIRMIQGMLISMIKTSDNHKLEKLITNFVENRINNWALCDSFISGLKLNVKQNKAWFYELAKFYANSEKPWEIRFGLVMFLCHFKEQSYFNEIKQMILAIKCEDYYVKMANAWLISVLYVEMKDETLDLLKNENLDNWTRNKAIQKIKESYRVSFDAKKEAENIKKNPVVKVLH